MSDAGVAPAAGKMPTKNPMHDPMAVPPPAAPRGLGRVGHHAARRHSGGAAFGLVSGLFDRPEHFADAIDTDRQHQKADALQEARDVEQHQSRRAGNLVEADGAKNQPQTDRQDRLGNVVAAKTHESSKGQ